MITNQRTAVKREGETFDLKADVNQDDYESLRSLVARHQQGQLTTAGVKNFAYDEEQKPTPVIEQILDKMDRTRKDVLTLQEKLVKDKELTYKVKKQLDKQNSEKAAELHKKEIQTAAKQLIQDGEFKTPKGR